MSPTESYQGQDIHNHITTLIGRIMDKLKLNKIHEPFSSLPLQ